MTPANAKNMKFTLRFPPDKIVGIHTGSFTAGASTTTTETIDHEYDQTVFTQMSWSIDGGTSWQDQFMGIPDLSTPSAPVFDTFYAGCYSTSSQIVIKAVSTLGSPQTVMYRIADFWKD